MQTKVLHHPQCKFKASDDEKLFSKVAAEAEASTKAEVDAKAKAGGKAGTRQPFPLTFLHQVFSNKPFVEGEV